MDKKKIGVLVTLGASLMWALEPVLVKLAYATSDAFHTMVIRSIMILLIALVYVFISNKGNFKINKKQFSVIFYIALAGTVIGDFLYFYSLTKISVINAVLIGHMQPIFVVLVGFFILEDKLKRFDYTGILFMILAGLFVTTATFDNLMSFKFGTLGDLYVLIATIAWASGAIAMKKYIGDMNSGVITFYRSLIALMFFSIYLVLKSQLFLPNIYQILIGFFVGIGSILYYEGLKRIKVAQVSALELSTPFFAAVLSFFILGELITFMQIIGIVLLFVGVYFLSKKED